MSTMSSSQEPGRFREARDLGSAYIAGRMRPDGTIERSHIDPSSYWGVPIALAVSGHSMTANRMLNWIRNNAFTPQGDFGPTPEKSQRFYYPYENSWLIEGAHRLGQFDLSQRGMDFIKNFWDPETGGFYSSFDERSRSTKMDIFVTSGCGRAAVYTNRTGISKGVGCFLETILESQPNYPKQMYSVFSPSKGIHTDPDPDDEMRYVMSQDAEKDQQFFNPGIAGGFLAKLYQSTREEKWLDLAKKYMLFAEGAGEYLFNLPGLRQGKTGWCASVLYTLTGEEKYRDIAIRIGDSIISYQSEQGFWYGLDEHKKPNLNLTAEMVVWLDEIHQATGLSETLFPAN